MNNFFVKIIPIILIFILGFFLKKIRLFNKEVGDVFLKFVFYVSLPALVFLSVSQMQISPNLIFLPFIAAAVLFSTYFISLFLSSKLVMSPQTKGTFLIGSMIMNTSFAIPFVFAAYGKEGIAAVSVFDFGNALLVMTFVYYTAMKYGRQSELKINFKKFLLIPPIWGLIIGFVANISKISLPLFCHNFLSDLGIITIPLTMFSLGIYFEPKVNTFFRTILVVFIRSGIGFLLGFLFVSLFQIHGLPKAIIIICTSSPVGYNTLIFSSLENLDKEFAAELISISILLGLIYLPVLLMLI